MLIDSCAGNADLTDAFERLALIRRSIHVGTTLVAEVVKFFLSKSPPVSAEETIELFAFMEAADESKRQGGIPVSLKMIMARARKKAGLNP